MKTWKAGAVTLATDELRQHVRGKRIALMMNTSAIGNDGRLLLDTVAEEKWADIACFYGMEHGVRGNLYAGNGDRTAVDAQTGIPIVSLYQFPKAHPTPELVRQVDAVVFCAQDVGVRHWTYTPWMMELIKAAAQAGTEVIVLDRPNPIRGDIVEGLCVEEKYVGRNLLSGFSYPLRHGMTVGELALMYKDVNHLDVRLTVLKCHGWKRDMWYDQTGLVWMPPSPNMPTVDTALYFAATGLMQSADFSLGTGTTTTPFQYVGAPYFSGEAIAKALNDRDIPGVYFVPKFYKAGMCDDSREPELCDGVMMAIHDRNIWRPVTTQLHIMDVLNSLYGERIDWCRGKYYQYGRVRMGTDEICDRMAQGQSLLPLIEKWEASAAAFAEARKPYLLY